MPLQTPRAEVLTVLFEAGHLNEEQYRRVEKESVDSGIPAETILLREKMVDEELLARAKGVVFGLPYVDLASRDIAPQNIILLPRDLAETARAVSFAKEDDTVLIGMVDPHDVAAAQAIDFLAQTAGFNPKYHVISSASFAIAFKKYEVLGKEVAKALEAAKEKLAVERPAEEKEAAIEEIVRGAPVSRIVSVILRHAVEGNASDIHIEPFGEETRVRYRVDGVLRTTLLLPKYVHSAVVSRIKVLASLKLDETRIPQDGRITETVAGRLIDYRVSTLPLAEAEKVVMRILDTKRGVPTLEQLGFRTQHVALMEREIRKPHGMFLITGPTGSGKSTTLFTVLSKRNDEGVNISTLEDPVEYYIKGVNQSQVRPEVGFTFASGIRALLRQDPNVIMVGEIRDSETAELAVHAALTGHLIFSTLHTNDAFGVVPRLIDMHAEPFLLSATLNIAVAQRLARKICERCKVPAALPEDVEARLRKEIESLPDDYAAHLDLSKTPLTVYKGMGCRRCGNTGYLGRVAVAEILVYDDVMRELITRGFPIEEVRAAAKKQGMLSLRQDGILKTLEGLSTMEEIMRISAE